MKTSLFAYNLSLLRRVLASSYNYKLNYSILVKYMIAKHILNLKFRLQMEKTLKKNVNIILTDYKFFLYHRCWRNTLTQCLRKKVVVRGINFRFFKYFAMEWWGGIVWPPSGPKKFGQTHWPAGLGRSRYQNRQK